MSAIRTPKLLESYIDTYTSRESAPLAALNKETNKEQGDAVMLSGHLQGAILQMLSHMIRPKCILEIGTFTGYSAICLAQGLQPGGMLHTIEVNKELEKKALKAFKKAKVHEKITQHIGYASTIIPTINETFDIVFLDADKPNYGMFYDLVFDKVPVGGYIIADNVLYWGEVTWPKELRSNNANGIHKFNKKIKADKRVEHVLLPIRDGVMIVRKLKN